MYITTSRNPSKVTKEFAKNLAFFLGVYGKYENRGRKSIDDVVKRAKELGYSEILIISEKEKRPTKISKIEIFGSKWKWTDEINFEDYSIKLNKEKIDTDLIKEGFEVKTNIKFFKFPKLMSDNFSIIKLDKRKNLIFSYEKNYLKLMKVKIKMEK